MRVSSKCFVLIQFIQQANEVGTVITILVIKKPRHTKMKELAQDYRAGSG